MEKAKELLEQQRPVEALHRLMKLLKKARKKEVWKIHALLGATFHDLADVDGVIQAFYNAMKTDTDLRNQRAHFSNYMFAIHYSPELTAETLRETAEAATALYLNDKLPLQSRTAQKIHVAYISPNFLDSAASRFYEALLTNYDREKFFVTAWTFNNKIDTFTQKVQRSVDGYFDISETDLEEAAEKIRDSGADVLFDLGGHTLGGITLQVAAYRPARVQISGIGYLDTTGVDAIDYFLTDDFLADGQSHFTEKLLKIDSAFALTPDVKMFAARKNLAPAPHENLTFGCLNNFMKITDEYLACVRAILDAVPDSRIIFRDVFPLRSRCESLAMRLADARIPFDRVDIRRGEAYFFGDYKEIDLILDTFPYTGGFMTALALYMGVPVVNLRGELHHSRIGADMLRLAGLENFVAANMDEYIAKAVNFRRPENICLDKLTDTKSFTANVYEKISEVAGVGE